MFLLHFSAFRNAAVEEGTHNLHFCRVEEFHDDPLTEQDRTESIALKQQGIGFAE